ncbi:MAG: hypothetical protein H7838_05605 [Magnetococcus sp. DMHC-8]
MVLRSDKPQAKPFRKWVTSEVLPTIRKTGSYSTPTRRQLPQVDAVTMGDSLEEVVAGWIGGL